MYSIPSYDRNKSDENEPEEITDISELGDLLS